MKSYLTNLMRALMGRNPFRLELDELQEKYDKTADNVKSMNSMYCTALEKWEDVQNKLESVTLELKSYRRLVENLRERIADKDKLIMDLEKELNEK